ncbi:hypothetical protein [Nocardiopsis flavescens]
MSGIARSVDRVLGCAGGVAAMLMDRPTGHVVAAAGDVSALPSAEAVADGFRAVLGLGAGGAGPVEVEGLALGTRERHIVVRPVAAPLPHDLLLVVVLDRGRTNAALAARQVDEYARGLLT